MTLNPQRIAARRRRRQLEARIMQGVMAGSLGVLIVALLLIVGMIVVRGLPTISVEMLTQLPKGGSYYGGKGGILNAIVGSLLLAVGGTLIAFLVGVPIALYLNAYAERSKFAYTVRLVLDVLWGIPSLLYGAFGFAIMLAVGLKASLLAGARTRVLVELPGLSRGLDERRRRVSQRRREGAWA